ncbi:MAG: RHS repeat-associated core domain-containing protein, partial [Humidesulfovibrio sp.]|uniref:RHS repeat-associated core domain-containing protein n=1 Tax=Humidesulfovibrio sp. TaxID=2910988 RepID=UPI0027F7867A
FAGGLFDADTGLTRFVWRDYDADTGRFTALDPLREKGGDSDWYGYCVDDPVNRVDVWGLADSFWDGQGGRIAKSGKTGASIGGTIGAAIGAPYGVPIPGRIAGSLIGSGIGMGTQAVMEYPPVRERVDELETKLDEWRQSAWDSIPPETQERLERVRSLEDYSTD